MSSVIFQEISLKEEKHKQCKQISRSSEEGQKQCQPLLTQADESKTNQDNDEPCRQVSWMDHWLLQPWFPCRGPHDTQVFQFWRATNNKEKKTLDLCRSPRLSFSWFLLPCFFVFWSKTRDSTCRSRWFRFSPCWWCCDSRDWWATSEFKAQKAKNVRKSLVLLRVLKSSFSLSFFFCLLFALSFRFLFALASLFLSTPFFSWFLFSSLGLLQATCSALSVRNSWLFVCDVLYSSSCVSPVSCFFVF